MLKIVECPACGNKGITIEVPKNKKFIATGKPLNEFNCSVICKVCKRKIKYTVEEE